MQSTATPSELPLLDSQTMRGGDPLALPSPAHVLSPRDYRHGLDSVLLVAGGIAGAGAAPLIHHGLLAVPALGAGCACAAARAAFGIRQKARGQLLDRLTEALAPSLGLIRPSRKSVRARKWTRGWPGLPTGLTLHYSAQVNDEDPQWAPAVVTIVSRRLLIPYRVVKHDRRRCVVRLQRVSTPNAKDATVRRPLLERAERTVTELVGPSAAISEAAWSATGELTGFTLTHAAGTKLAASGYRRRVETVVSTMLPGRWRARWDLEADQARFEVRPSFPANVWIPTGPVADADILSSYDSVELPYAIDEDGQVQVWRPAHDPNLMLVGAPGTGKALSLDTPIATATGWTTMGEIGAGDVVFDETGQPCTVLAAHPVRYDRPCYEVTFSDGSVVTADEEHLWWTSTRAERSSSNRHQRRWDDLRPQRLSRPLLDALCAELTERPDNWLTVPDVTRLIGVDANHAFLRGLAATLTDTSLVRVGPRHKPAKAYRARDLLQPLYEWGSAPYRSGKSRMAQGAVRTTGQIQQSLTTADGTLNHAIPVAQPLQLDTADLPIPAYALGVWLGDGDHWNSIFTSADPEMVFHLADVGVTVSEVRLPPSTPSTYRARRYRMNGMYGPLDKLGLLRRPDPQRRIRSKRIPVPYLRASAEQRRDLLAGLMDTDGTVSPTGACQLTTTSPQLATDVHELACSLGFRASTTQGVARLAGRDCGAKWTISWTTDTDVFRLERKCTAHKQRAMRYNAKRNTQRYITSVRAIDSVPVRCITVDSPNHLYLAGRSLIPTHNTVTAHTLLVTAGNYGWPIWVVDGKSIEFLGFQGWPNVQIVATTIEQQIAVIHRAWEVMEHRYNLIVTGRARESDFEPLLVFLDEFADFRSNLLAWYAEVKVKGDPTKPVVLSRAASISRKGRTSRVHLVFGTQRPDAEYFGGDMRDNFRMRVSMGRLSPQGAMMMWESPAVGTTIPRGCRGRATTINDDNRPVEVQTYRTPDPRKAAPGSDEAALLERLRPAQARHERLLILEPDPSAQFDTGEPPTYNDYAGATWVRAHDHPELDPVIQRQTYAGGGRDAASPMAIFGLATPTGATAKLPRPADTNRADGPLTETPEMAAPVEYDVNNADDGYGAAGSSRPAAVQIGDLILVDEDTGQWATVDELPETDYADDGFIALSWRDDEDNCGSLSVPDDAFIPVRRPTETDQ